MDVSNKTLAMFLVAAIVASIAGTMISLDKLGGISYGPTGFAPHDYTGNVTINISETLSITIDGDNVIDFGQCTSQSVVNKVNSEGLGNPGICDANDGSDNLIIYNDGNVDANVTVNVSNNGPGNSVGSGTFLQSPVNSTYVEYKLLAGDADCTGGTYVNSYTNFTGGTFNDLCDNLTYSSNGVDGRVQFDVQITFPSDVPSAESNFEVTFWGQQRT